MSLKHLGVVLVMPLLWCGCRQGDSNRRVEELRSQQQEHARQISRISKQIDAIDETLARIQESVNALRGGGAGASPGEGAEMTVASNFASTKEYQDIMQHIASFEEQLVALQGDYVGFTEEQKKISQREALRDPRSAFRAMGDPKQLSDRLDNLVKNFSGKIDDPATRNQFVADVENLKTKYSVSLSLQEKKEQARALLTEAISATTDERRKGWMERQLRSLDEASGEDLQRRVDFSLQFQRMREISNLTQKYNIPSEVVRDSGLISFGGRGGPFGFFGRRGGRRGQ